MGSITHIVDDRNILNQYEYDAWGNLVSQKETIKNRFKFTGEQLDPITQQYYLRARFYNPVIARFTQEDTYRGDGLNLYAYCRNNPVYYTDPTGNSSCPSENKVIEGAINNNNPKNINGNSKSSAKIQHGYEIYNKETGDVIKTGISGQSLNKNGTSPRANTQVSKLNKSAGTDIYDARVVETNINNRAEAL